MADEDKSTNVAAISASGRAGTARFLSVAIGVTCRLTVRRNAGGQSKRKMIGAVNANEAALQPPQWYPVRSRALPSPTPPPRVAC
jgi:hypothetical protein